MNLTDTIAIWDDISLNQGIFTFDYRDYLYATPSYLDHANHLAINTANQLMEEYSDWPTKLNRDKYMKALSIINESRHQVLKL